MSPSRIIRSSARFALQVFTTSVVVLVCLGLFRSSSSSAGPNTCQSDIQLFSADANSDGVLDISDPIWLLSYMFEGGPPPYFSSA